MSARLSLAPNRVSLYLRAIRENLYPMTAPSNSETYFDNVLLIEDDASHAHLAVRALLKFCSAVDTVGTFAQAKIKLEAKRYSLIVTDLNLPDCSGTALVEYVRANTELPVIVLTASTALSDAVAAMKLGAQDFLVKDFHPDFTNVLGLALKRLRSQIDSESERARLNREMGLLRSAIESSNDGLAVVSRSGEIQYANQSFLTFKEGCGITGANILSSEPGVSPLLQQSSVQQNGIQQTSVQQTMQAVASKLTSLALGASWQTEMVVHTDRDHAYTISVVGVGGSQVPLTEDTSFSADNVALGAQPKFVLWVRDVTDQRHREKFQKEILSTTTHDLKGPLGAIMISSEMLAEMLKGQGKPHELALRIGSSAHGAANLIDEFLSARRIQEGNFILRPSENDVAELIKEDLDGFATVASARGIKLATEVASDVGKIKIDRMGFLRVLSNLMSNALKFTPRGGAVNVGACRVDGNLRVDVRDSGSGMEPSELKRIFERFGRLDRHRELAGTGLGLFVVKCIVSAHGGKIEVTSKVGEGTTFSVIFPADPPVNERGELISLDFA